MKNLAIVFVGLTLAAGSLGAQGNDPDKVTATGGVTVPGWQGRIDPQAAKGGRSITQDKVTAMGTGFHVTSGPAAIYWNPKNTATGNYTVTATFTQTKAPTHPEAYGLVLGGADLTTPNQSYFYFLVRGDGKYLINHRANDSTVHKIVEWTASPAIKTQDADGKATNKVSIVAGADKVSFLVNGIEVATKPRSAIVAKGIAGVRVNHNLDVHVDGFAVTSAK
ncbi:MAG TPA: hypothetical protein VM099_13905 [Gemmatimonadaceae bacterium]|nr:hypothetical protein [Gemmatimonadaceae bacterium]